jgi:hypothetical protein
MSRNLLPENQTERYNSEELDTGGKTILKWISGKWGGSFWTGFIWFKREICDRHL